MLAADFGEKASVNRGHSNMRDTGFKEESPSVTQTNMLARSPLDKNKSLQSGIIDTLPRKKSRNEV